MKIEYINNYGIMSQKAASMVFEDLLLNPAMLLCTASGASPEGLYKVFVDKCASNPIRASQLRILNLDEWGGIPKNNLQTCETYLQKNLVIPLKLDSDRFVSFDSNSIDPDKECSRVASYLKGNGPIDLCILGLGRNGHVAFNEPSDFLHPFSHIAILSGMSLQHPMAGKMGVVPTYGLTIGMADILQSKKIIILVSGKGKNEIANEFLSARISSQLPASFLWLHPNVTCFVDKNTIYIKD